MSDFDFHAFDLWKSDVGPWPTHEEPARCFCCGQRPHAFHSVVCDAPECREWLEEGKRIHATRST